MHTGCTSSSSSAAAAATINAEVQQLAAARTLHSAARQEPRTSTAACAQQSQLRLHFIAMTHLLLLVQGCALAAFQVMHVCLQALVAVVQLPGALLNLLQLLIGRLQVKGR
jgi:hypothetical protein